MLSTRFFSVSFPSSIRSPSLPQRCRPVQRGDLHCPRVPVRNILFILFFEYLFLGSSRLFPQLRFSQRFSFEAPGSLSELYVVLEEAIALYSFYGGGCAEFGPLDFCSFPLDKEVSKLMLAILRKFSYTVPFLPRSRWCPLFDQAVAPRDPIRLKISSIRVDGDSGIQNFFFIFFVWFFHFLLSPFLDLRSFSRFSIHPVPLWASIRQPIYSGRIVPPGPVAPFFLATSILLLFLFQTLLSRTTGVSRLLSRARPFFCGVMNDPPPTLPPSLCHLWRFAGRCPGVVAS